jgi:hypothetical protein
MRSETDLKNQVQRAHRADELLNDPMIQEFIISLRGDLLNKFESTALDDEDERMAAWNQSQVLNSFLDKFTKLIKEGKNARLTLAERATAQIRRII